MKKKMTRNDVYELAGGRHILKVPYCAAQGILRHLEPVGYNSGVYGWNYDVYDCGYVVVVTGYRMAVKGVQATNRSCEWHEEDAKESSETEEAKALGFDWEYEMYLLYLSSK